MREVVIAGYARSPFQPAHKGELVCVRPDELAAQVIAGLIERSPIEPGAIEDLIVGCAFPEGEQGLNVARLIGFLARLPESVAATTVNRFCGSSMQAVHMAAGAVAMGAGDAFVCAGVESMSRVPVMGFNTRAKALVLVPDRLGGAGARPAGRGQVPGLRLWRKSSFIT